MFIIKPWISLHELVYKNVRFKPINTNGRLLTTCENIAILNIYVDNATLIMLVRIKWKKAYWYNYRYKY